MPNNWKTYKLGDIGKVIGGGTPSTKNPDYYNGDIAWITPRDLSNYNSKFISKGERSITEKGLDKSSARLMPKGTVLMSSRAPIGYLAISENEVSTNQGFKSIVVDSKKADNHFIYYLLKDSIDILKQNASGSTFQEVSGTVVKNLEVDLPPLPEQKAIANILSAIDDKIENNLAINKTLEDMAMALYKHWFVDFGPFQEGDFVESELGLIPEGWEVKRLGDLVEKLSKGTTPRMKDVGELECTIPFLKVKDVSSEGEIDSTGLSFIPESIHLNQLKRSILEEGDLLFSIAGTIGRVSIIPDSLDNSNCNQALAFIRLCDKSKYNTLIYNWLKSEEVQNEIESSIVQGVQANVSLTVLKELQLVIPNNETMVVFSKKINPIHNLILDNQSENQNLIKLRDTLLPKLISGEVRLKEFQNQIEKVL